MSNKFSSEGFDLDDIATEDKVNDVIYEIGGGTTVIETPKPPSPPAVVVEEEEKTDDMAPAEEWKKQGNEQFKQGKYLEAYDLYTEAIEATPPGELNGEQILKLREEFDQAEREKLSVTRAKMAAEERKMEKEKKDDKSKTSQSTPKPAAALAEFKLPPQEHGDKLAVYYCNRAATLTYMERFDEAIKDCDISVLLNPKYTKAFVRRSAAYERSERNEDALRDAKKALEVEPSNATIRKSVARLQKLEDERLEKLKEETMGKLYWFV
jgi:tetratricopeptide (TPR) repeat protein